MTAPSRSAGQLLRGITDLQDIEVAQVAKVIGVDADFAPVRELASALPELAAVIQAVCESGTRG